VSRGGMVSTFACDRAYAAAQVKAHKAAVALFQREAAYGS